MRYVNGKIVVEAKACTPSHHSADEYNGEGVKEKYYPPPVLTQGIGGGTLSYEPDGSYLIQARWDPLVMKIKKSKKGARNV